MVRSFDIAIGTFFIGVFVVSTFSTKYAPCGDSSLTWFSIAAGVAYLRLATRGNQ